MLWCAALLIGTLLAVLALRPLLYAAMNSLAEKTGSDKGADYEANRRRATLVHPDYRLTVLAFVYALIVANACGIIDMRVGVADPEDNAIAVNISAGLTAAAALLEPAGAALFVASMVGLIIAPRYGNVLAGSGLLSVIWLFTGGAGCLVGAVVAATVGAPVAEAWVGMGLVLFAAGFWRRQARCAKGLTVLEKARRAEQGAQHAQAEEAAAIAPAEGQYYGPPRAMYWGLIGGVFALPVVFFAGAVALFNRLVHGAILRQPGFLPVFVPFVFGVGAFLALVTWLTTMRLARAVTWDECGVQVSWYRGDTRRFSWDQLRALKVREGQRGPTHWLVTAASGEKFLLRCGYPRSTELIEALEAHIWARGQ